jgi:hypothetical protein
VPGTGSYGACREVARGPAGGSVLCFLIRMQIGLLAFSLDFYTCTLLVLLGFSGLVCFGGERMPGPFPHRPCGNVLGAPALGYRFPLKGVPNA